jgi:hypothetical protein
MALGLSHMADPYPILEHLIQIAAMSDEQSLTPTNLWTVTIPNIAQILNFSNELCDAIPQSSDHPTSEEAEQLESAISETQKAKVQEVIQTLNGPDHKISWQQTMRPKDHTDSATFTLFPTLPTELRLKIWRHACDGLRFPGGLGSGRVPLAVYGEPLGLMLACKESKTVLDESMTKCSVCLGTWIKLDDGKVPSHAKRDSCWRDRMVFVKGSKIPCSSCDVQGGSGGFSMRIRYLMQYGNIWSEGQYHSTFLLMGKRLKESDAVTFVLPHFVEDLTGKGYLRKVSILQEDPGEREVYTSVLAPDVELVRSQIF